MLPSRELALCNPSLLSFGAQERALYLRIIDNSNVLVDIELSPKGLDQFRQSTEGANAGVAIQLPD